jgi:hypothetical protein
MNLYEGTTPTLTFTFPDTVDLSDARNVYITFSDSYEKMLFTKTGDALVIDVNKAGVFLDQEETLSFPKDVVIQVNWTYDDNPTKRACSNKVKIKSISNLIKEVIP